MLSRFLEMLTGSSSEVSKLHLWLSSIKLEIQGSLGTRSLPFIPLSLSVSVSALRHYEMCNYTHTKATAFHATSIGFGAERMKGGIERKTKRRKEIGLVTIFHVTGVIDNVEPGQGSLIW